MTDVPSLSLWSSIKIPASVYLKKNKNNKLPSSPFMDTYDSVTRSNCVKKFEPVGELVNLEVPSPLVKGKENNTPVLECCEVHKKEAAYKSPAVRKKISFVTVPQVHYFENHNFDDSDSCSYENEMSESICCKVRDDYKQEEGVLDWDFEKNADMYIADDEEGEREIPVIKPWTSEEVEKIDSEKTNKGKKIKKKATAKKARKRGRKNSKKICDCNENFEMTPCQKPPTVDPDMDFCSVWHSRSKSNV